jgi:polyribonucleotide 5'-hydroxyl-kinase
MRSVFLDASTTDNSKLVSINPSLDLVNSIAAVLHPVGDIEETARTDVISHTNIAGFIYIIQIDIESDIMTILQPCPGNLPSKNLLVGSIKWVQ